MTSDMFIISLACALQIFTSITLSHYLTVDSQLNLPYIQKGTKFSNEILSSEETFRHPAFLIPGNPVVGYFHKSPSGHRPMTRLLPAGTVFTYSPPLSPIMGPVSGNLISHYPSELPKSWSPLVASTGDKVPTGQTPSNALEVEENKSEESQSNGSPARSPNEELQRPQFLYPDRSMLPPYRHPSFIPHSGMPNRGFGMIINHQPNDVNKETVPKEIKETIRSVETSDEIKASEALSKATFIQTNWIALITSMILLMSAALGVVGYFVWKGRVDDGSVPPPVPPRTVS